MICFMGLLDRIIRTVVFLFTTPPGWIILAFVIITLIFYWDEIVKYSAWLLYALIAYIVYWIVRIIILKIKKSRK
jgi:hypothetical protein